MPAHQHAIYLCTARGSKIHSFLKFVRYFRYIHNSSAVLSELGPLCPFIIVFNNDIYLMLALLILPGKLSSYSAGGSWVDRNK